jgi:ATP-dependent Clp protease ATP-binding subunit ClpA
VGKTELAKQFASIMEMELIRFDMSEYMEQHAASKLIGTPPGYVGFDQGGLLTDAVANHPYAVVLLDEIEKANYEICNLLLQIMDYGVLKDHHGKMINFSHCVIIMTTNIGAETYQTSGFGFGGDAQSSRQLEAIRAYFSPEFMNRLDAVIPFSPLARITMDQVVYKFMEELRLQLSEKGMMLQCDDAVYDYLSSEGYSPIYGARPLGRLIQEKIKKPLADKILFEPIASGSRLTLRMKDGEIALDCSMAIVQPCNDDA